MKFPSWCESCEIRHTQDICEWCKIERGTHKPNGYQSEEDVRQRHLAMIDDYTQKDVGAQ